MNRPERRFFVARAGQAGAGHSRIRFWETLHAATKLTLRISVDSGPFPRPRGKQPRPSVGLLALRRRSVRRFTVGRIDTLNAAARTRLAVCLCAQPVGPDLERSGEPARSRSVQSRLTGSQTADGLACRGGRVRVGRKRTLEHHFRPRRSRRGGQSQCRLCGKSAVTSACRTKPRSTFARWRTTTCSPTWPPPSRALPSWYSCTSSPALPSLKSPGRCWSTASDCCRCRWFSRRRERRSSFNSDALKHLS